jgi:hypothetical protein
VKRRETSLQLEVMIKRAVSRTFPLPKNLVVSIWPDGDSWKAVAHSPNPSQDKEIYECVRAQAALLKKDFDLDLQ